LTTTDFDFKGDPPTITIEAAYARNGRRDKVPISPEFARVMRRYLEGRLPACPVFNTPGGNCGAKMLRIDLAGDILRG